MHELMRDQARQPVKLASIPIQKNLPTSLLHSATISKADRLHDLWILPHFGQCKPGSYQMRNLRAGDVAIPSQPYFFSPLLFLPNSRGELRALALSFHILVRTSNFKSSCSTHFCRVA